MFCVTQAEISIKFDKILEFNIESYTKNGRKHIMCVHVPDIIISNNIFFPEELLKQKWASEREETRKSKSKCITTTCPC